MKHFLLATLLTTAAVLLYACQKEPPPPPTRVDIIDYTVLPPITQEGKNTFGCKVNGEVWVPRVEVFVPVTDLVCTSPKFIGDELNYFSIDANLLTDDKYESLHIFFGSILLAPHRLFNTDTSKSSMQFWDITNTGGYYMVESDSTQNWVDISLVDTVKHVISGTFQFNLANGQNPNKKISITDGRFDLKYTPE